MFLGFFLIALLAVGTGLLSGLLGIGGNMLAIPILLYIFKAIFHFSPALAMHITIGTCMMVMVFTTASAAIAHYQKNNIEWNVYKKIAPFMIIGSMSGALCASMVNGVILEKIFGLFLIIVSMQMLISKPKIAATDKVRTIPLTISIIAGFFIGFKSGLLGIGGGAVLIPLLIFLNYPSKLVTGTTSLCSLTMAIVGALIFLLKGASYNLGIPYTIGFIYWPALIVMAPLTFISAKFGAKLSMQASHKQLKVLFIILLTILGIQMLI